VIVWRALPCATATRTLASARTCRRDRLVAWGVTLLAVVLAVGYQLLPRIDELLSVVRRH
jgi:hypothetical protein